MVVKQTYWNEKQRHLKNLNVLKKLNLDGLGWWEGENHKIEVKSTKPFFYSCRWVNELSDKNNYYNNL